MQELATNAQKTLLDFVQVCSKDTSSVFHHPSLVNSLDRLRHVASFETVSLNSNLSMEKVTAIAEDHEHETVNFAARIVNEAPAIFEKLRQFLSAIDDGSFQYASSVWFMASLFAQYFIVLDSIVSRLPLGNLTCNGLKCEISGWFITDFKLQQMYVLTSVVRRTNVETFFTRQVPRQSVDVALGVLAQSLKLYRGV